MNRPTDDEIRRVIAHLEALFVAAETEDVQHLPLDTGALIAGMRATLQWVLGESELPKFLKDPK